MTPTEAAFHRAMVELYERSKREIPYNATLFMRMLSDHYGLGTAQRLLATSEVSDGFTTLLLAGRLDLSVEATVLKPEFRSLFNADELNEAKRRLEMYGYLPPVQGD